MIDWWIYSLAGGGVGFIVGLTGIGGGALMTPILMTGFGVAPNLAVGTDLLFALVTKMFGATVHGRHGTIDWVVVRRLAWGSLPAAALTAVFLAAFGHEKIGRGLIVTTLGVALIVTGGVLLLKNRLHDIGRRLRTDMPAQFKALQPALTVVAGVIIGVLVTLTSVGAGALGTVMMAYLYPYRLTPAKLVGTDLVHALPLALVAGMGHLFIGNVNFQLLGWLLAGSIPGILLGSVISTRASSTWIGRAIAIVLGIVGFRLLV